MLLSSMLLWFAYGDLRIEEERAYYEQIKNRPYVVSRMTKVNDREVTFTITSEHDPALLALCDRLFWMYEVSDGLTQELRGDLFTHCLGSTAPRRDGCWNVDLDRDNDVDMDDVGMWQRRVP